MFISGNQHSGTDSSAMKNDSWRPHSLHLFFLSQRHLSDLLFLLLLTLLFLLFVYESESLSQCLCEDFCWCGFWFSSCSPLLPLHLLGLLFLRLLLNLLLFLVFTSGPEDDLDLGQLNFS